MEQQKQLHLIMEWDLQWFAKDGPGGEKTEPATSKKLDDVSKETEGGKRGWQSRKK